MSLSFYDRLQYTCFVVIHVQTALALHGAHLFYRLVCAQSFRCFVWPKRFLKLRSAFVKQRVSPARPFPCQRPAIRTQNVSSGVDSHKGLAQQQLGVLVGPGLRWQRLEEHDAALSAQIANVRGTTARRQRSILTSTSSAQ